jgi:gamma-glutamyltranspeptidase/glutathione hydrolase
VITPSLPSSGGIVLSACLGLFEAEGLGDIAANSVERYVAYARVMQTAFRLRGALLGDPAHVPAEALAAAAEVAERPFRRGDLAELARRLERNIPGNLGNEQNTTHLCVIDKHGNAVSNTYSLNTIFGAKLVVSGGGFFLNNTIDDFSLAEGAPNWYELSDGQENLLQPGKRPVSSMTPTIILSDEAGQESHVEMVLGGSGGPRIPTLLFQIAQSTLGDHTPVEEAVRQPRVHHQYQPVEIAVEHAMPRKVRDVLADYCEPGEVIADTPVLGIAAAIHVSREAQNQRKADGDARLAAVLDSRFTLV